ncbi:MAG: SM-20-related protein [Sphingomonadales bacterium]|jgi:hypothetical protein|nr:SM-20-related protein [Sphingomonadales bacterium]
MAEGFALDSGIDPEKLAAEYTARGRIRIEPFLSAESAARLRDHLRGRADWRLSLKGPGEKVVEFDEAARTEMSPEHARGLEKLAAPDRPGFRFLYERVWASSAEASGQETSPLAAFAEFLRGEPVLDLLGRITGAADIVHADVQATRYAAGHFLSIHDDIDETHDRRVAYVLGLTEGWRTEWGGLLLFHDRRGDVVEGWRPRFNAMTLFAVPQLHSVEAVIPHAPKRRYAVSGWLTASRPADAG